jgi:hypothetical protein
LGQRSGYFHKDFFRRKRLQAAQMIFAIAPSPGPLAAGGFAGEAFSDRIQVWYGNYFALGIGDSKYAKSRYPESGSQMHQTGIVGNHGRTLLQQCRRITKGQFAHEIPGMVRPRPCLFEVGIIRAQILFRSNDDDV